MYRTSLFGVALLVAACSGGDKSTDGVMAGSYESITVKDPQQSAAFLAVEDLDSDGFKEIILSTLLEQSPPGPPGPLSRGALRVFHSTGVSPVRGRRMC